MASGPAAQSHSAGAIERLDRYPTAVLGVVDDVSDVDLLQLSSPTTDAAWTSNRQRRIPDGAPCCGTAGEPQVIAQALRPAIANAYPMLGSIGSGDAS